jgi:alkylhydroperoxidase family enzyme
MARIPLQEPEDASPEVQEIYARLVGVRGYLNNVSKMFGNHAEFLAGFAHMVAGLYGKSARLAPRHRELAYLRASQLNACHY